MAPAAALDFDALYAGRLLPSLRALDAERAKLRDKYLLALAFSAAAALWALGYAGGHRLPLGLAAIPFVVGMGLALWVLEDRRKAYVARYKEEVMRQVVSFIDPQLTFSPRSGLPLSTFTHSGIFRKEVDRYSCEDLVEGILTRTPLRFSEVHAEYRTQSTDSKGRTTENWHTIFRGILFCADFHKHFQGKTYVLTDVAQRWLGVIGSMIQSAAATHGQLVQLESPEFEREFAVYSASQVEARYILTPSLMERILGFKRRTGKSLQLAFVDSLMYMAIPYGANLFEPSLLSSLIDPGPIKLYFDELATVVSIVEELNLNQRIWTKA